MNHNENIYKYLPDERKFGYFFSIVFFLIFLYLFFKSNLQNFNVLILITSFIFFFISLLKPILLKIPNLIWFHLGLFLGKYFSIFLMIFIFYFVMTSIGIFLKIFRVDSLKKKFGNDTKDKSILSEENILKDE